MELKLPDSEQSLDDNIILCRNETGLAGALLSNSPLSVKPCFQ